MTRRRRWAAAVAGAPLVAAAVLLVARAGPPDPGGPPGARPPATAPERPGPVLLVPGYGGSTAALDALAARIRAAGRPALVVALPGDGTGDLRGQALALGAAAVAARAGGAGPVDVVGYSAGGVVARLWAKDGGAALARRVVTLGSPHHGTELARFAATYAPDACPRACQQLVPGSRLLTELNTAPEVPPGPAWVSVWTTHDETVTPPESARLAGATNLPVQAVCPGAVVAHGALPTDPVVTELVLRALGLTPDPVIHCAVGDATRGAPR